MAKPDKKTTLRDFQEELRRQIHTLEGTARSYVSLARKHKRALSKTQSVGRWLSMKTEAGRRRKLLDGRTYIVRSDLDVAVGVWSRQFGWKYLYRGASHLTHVALVSP